MVPPCFAEAPGRTRNADVRNDSGPVGPGGDHGAICRDQRVRGAVYGLFAGVVHGGQRHHHGGFPGAIRVMLGTGPGARIMPHDATVQYAHLPLPACAWNLPIMPMVAILGLVCCAGLVGSSPNGIDGMSNTYRGPVGCGIIMSAGWGDGCQFAAIDSVSYTCRGGGLPAHAAAHPPSPRFRVRLIAPLPLDCLARPGPRTPADRWLPDGSAAMTPGRDRWRRPRRLAPALLRWSLPFGFPRDTRLIPSQPRQVSGGPLRWSSRGPAVWPLVSEVASWPWAWASAWASAWACG